MYKYHISHAGMNFYACNKLEPQIANLFIHYDMCIYIYNSIESLRQGGHNDKDLLHDPSSGLTYTALCSIRKQSVEDVERLFSEDLIKWMEGKGYTSEAHLRIIRNCRRGCDEWGLTGSQRSLYNNEFLEYLLDDIMPWHREKD